jgi:DNA-binding IclR family transcriptional regulator
MNKFARMIDVLDLYSDNDTLLTAEDIAGRLQLSRPTAFRYVRELSQAGFLANYSGRYALGARIITLDFRIRQTDPVLKVAPPLMKALATETACSAVLCRMYNDEVINVHEEASYDDPDINYLGRGRPLPLFRGSAPKSMLAHLPPARLKKLYDRHAGDPDVLAIASDWTGFKAYYARIRQAGHYISRQEVDSHTVGISAPVLVPGLGAVAVLCLVLSPQRLSLLNPEGLATVLRRRAAELGQALSGLAEG